MSWCEVRMCISQSISPGCLAISSGSSSVRYESSESTGKIRACLSHGLRAHNCYQLAIVDANGRTEFWRYLKTEDFNETHRGRAWLVIYMVIVGIWASWTISTTITILKLWIYQKLTSCIGIARPWCLAGSQDLDMTGILRGVPTVSKSDKQVTAFQLELLS